MKEQYSIHIPLYYSALLCLHKMLSNYGKLHKLSFAFSCKVMGRVLWAKRKSEEVGLQLLRWKIVSLGIYCLYVTHLNKLLHVNIHLRQAQCLIITQRLRQSKQKSTLGFSSFKMHISRLQGFSTRSLSLFIWTLFTAGFSPEDTFI